MKKIDLTLDTGDTELGELRPILGKAISDHFADGFLHHEWQGDVLRLSGPGASGSLIHEGGRLRLRAELRAPASWAHKVIRKKISAALADVAAEIKPG